MKPRITVLTIGVDDLKKSLKFYRDGLGLETQGIVGEEFEYGAVVFFDLQNGFKLALYPSRKDRNPDKTSRFWQMKSVFCGVWALRLSFSGTISPLQYSGTSSRTLRP